MFLPPFFAVVIVVVVPLSLPVQLSSVGFVYHHSRALLTNIIKTLVQLNGIRTWLQTPLISRFRLGSQSEWMNKWMNGWWCWWQTDKTKVKRNNSAFCFFFCFEKREKKKSTADNFTRFKFSGLFHWCTTMYASVSEWVCVCVMVRTSTYAPAHTHTTIPIVIYSSIFCIVAHCTCGRMADKCLSIISNLFCDH